MIDHVSIAVTDLSRAISFYEALLSPLGHAKLQMSDTAAGFGKSYPEFWLNLREGGNAASGPSNSKAIGQTSGAHVALRAGSMR